MMDLSAIHYSNHSEIFVEFLPSACSSILGVGDPEQETKLPVGRM